MPPDASSPTAGGCGCKIAPGVLREMLAGSAAAMLPGELLVGIETSDDAAVYRLNDRQAIVATTDFFMPIVDDPGDFGRSPPPTRCPTSTRWAPRRCSRWRSSPCRSNALPADTIRAILAGGEAACRAAGIPIAGGHTIDSVEPIYGLVAIGVVDPQHLKRNVGAQPGDALVLGKPLGVGIYSAALKKQQLDATAYAAMRATATRLNTPGIALGRDAGVHALTDVTGFGLLGHLLEVCRGSGRGRDVDFDRVPLLPATRALAAQGFVTGASARNFAGYGDAVSFATEDADRARHPHRPADLGRPARRLRALARRRHARGVSRRGLQRRRCDRRDRRGRAARGRPLAPHSLAGRQIRRADCRTRRVTRPALAAPTP